MTSEQAPVVAVVVATKDRPAQFLELLEALRNQTVPYGMFEVLVADDASHPPLSQWVEPSSWPFPMRILRRETAGGPGVARNTAMTAMSPTVRLVAFTDDDCLPDPHWLQALVDAHRQHPTALLGGQLRNAATDYICSEASQVISDLVYAFYNDDPEQARFFSTNNAAVDAALLREHGNFNENYTGGK